MLHGIYPYITLSQKLHTNILPISKQVSFLPLALLVCRYFYKTEVYCAYAMLDLHIKAATLPLIH